MKLAGCVILYNPDNDVADNIRTYIDYLDKLFVVDNQNGRKVFDELSKVYKNIELVSYAENMGIAKPLNDVLKMAKGNYTHLLTMDQDSFFEEDDIKKYIELAHEIEWSNVLGIAPQYINKNVAKQRKITNDTWNETWSVITSGNIINTANAVTIGGFDENLFIDEDSAYQKALSLLLKKKTDFLNYRAYIQSLPAEQVTDKKLENLEKIRQTFEDAEKALNSAYTTAMKAIDTARDKVNDAYKSVTDTIMKGSNKLQGYLNDASEHTSTALTNFTNKFESNYSTATTYAMNTWNTIHSDLKAGYQE